MRGSRLLIQSTKHGKITDRSTCFVATTSLPPTKAPLATSVRARANLGGNGWSLGREGKARLYVSRG